VAPPTAVMASVGGHIVRAHAGPFVAPYLAAHLATHQLAPLLWLVDFVTLWGSSSEATRAQSERTARAVGLAQYLTWARDRGALLQRACEGDGAALGALGVGDEHRADVHSIWRHLALAASARDRVHVAAAFVVPRPVRHSVRAFARYTIARLRTRLRALWGASRSYERSSPVATPGSADRLAAFGRPLRLDRSELITLTGDVIRAGGAVWIRAPGGSMLPTIQRGSLVRVEAVPTEGIVNGDVVLALTADGEPLLHRAIDVAASRITTRGDAAIHEDPPVPLARVIGIATHVHDRDGQRSVGRHPRRSLTITVLKLRRRVARVVRRAH